MPNKVKISKANKLWDSLISNPKWKRLARTSVNDSKQIEKHRKDLFLFLMKELKNV